MKISALLVMFLFVFYGCASGVQKLRKIQPGMAVMDVDNIMGERDGFRVAEKGSDTYTLYSYTNQYCNAHVSIYDKCDFFVIFKNGKVIETGTKDVRSNAPQMHYLYVFN